MNEQAMQERREIPRWRIGRAARVTFKNSGAVHEGFVGDMHLKGMSLLLSQPLSTESALLIVLTLAGRHDFDVEAEVRWMKEEDGRYVHGLFFKKILDPERERLFAYISQHCADQIQARWWA